MKTLPELEDFLLIMIKKLGYPEYEINRDYKVVEPEERAKWKNYLKLRAVSNDIKQFIDKEYR